VPFTVVWSPQAAIDLEGIVVYLQGESATVATQVAEKILSACDKLERFPMRGRRVPELVDVSGHNLREIIINPWRVIYEVLDQKIQILMVIDARRDMQAQLVNLSLRMKA
jgi:addiction module RelE/StbE family toxin